MDSPGGPVICAVVARTRHKMMQMEIVQAARRGARLIELRLDFLVRPPDFKRLLANKPCPMIATVRRPADGGRWGHSEEERQVLLRQAIVAGFDWVDLETEVANKIRRFGKVKRIISYHNLREVPENLEEIHRTMCGQDPDVVKLAVNAQHPHDNLRLLDLVQKSTIPTIGLCMGDLGTCSRVLNGRAGAPFTYGTFNKERAIAPGILTFEDLHSIYHYEDLRFDTQVFGLVGDPVAHSLSPLLHNRAFQALGINAVYVPFRVPRGELPDFLRDYAQVPVQGYSVTIPHKEAAAKAADLRDFHVEQCGAANTLVRSDHGWKAVNTDAIAAVSSLIAHLPEDADGNRRPLSTRSALILGAGGVARSIAHALRQEGVNLTLTNRTLERAQHLAEEVGCRFVEWDARHNGLYDTLINCTSVGMHPDLDESPVHGSMLKDNMLVFDTVYNPETTLLLREAKERGCHTLSGVDMFVRQAGLQFELFTGRQPPYELMFKLARRALSPITIRDDEESS